MECIKNEYPREDYYLKMQMDCRKVLVGYGRYLEKNEIKGQGDIEDYEDFLNNAELIENENKIYDFINKLKTEEYKVILYNGQTPILKDDIGFMDFVLDDLNEDSTVELGNDIIVIHMDKETIELKGYKEMSDNEIIARKYLDECQNDLVIKDNEEQSEFREDNFIDIEKENYYDKCKDIIDIDIFIGDESDPIWRMNWDAIWVTYEDRKELWQRP